MYRRKIYNSTKLHFDLELEEFPETRENVEPARHFGFRVTTSGYSHVSHRWHDGNYNKVSMDEQFSHGWTSSKWAPRY